MSIDGSEVLTMMPDFEMKMPDNMPVDSVISIVDVLRDSISNITPEIEQDLNNIEPFFLRIESDVANRKLNISVFGDFKDTDALNSAFTSLGNLQEAQKKDSQDKPSMSFFQVDGGAQLFWDGKVMKRTIRDKDNVTDEAEESEESLGENPDDMFSKFFSQGKMVVKYHFPSEVEKISNPNAVMTQDRKTVIIEYSGSSFISPKKEELDIEVKTKR